MNSLLARHPAPQKNQPTNRYSNVYSRSARHRAELITLSHRGPGEIGEGRTDPGKSKSKTAMACLADL